MKYSFLTNLKDGSKHRICNASPGRYLSPMDVYTPEQKKFVKLLMGTYIDNVEVRNDSLFLTISHEDFVNKGIPEPYYDQILHDIRGLNSLKKDGFDFGGKTMAGWWEQEREKLREELFAD